QGIIHGGLKYTLDGLLTADADAIGEMPALWRSCLAGQRRPNLSAVKLRGDHCHLWRTSSLKSQLGMLGARVGLRVKPEKLAREDWPAALRGCPGEVFRLDEQVLEPGSLLQEFSRALQSRLIRSELTAISNADKRPVIEFRDESQSTIASAPTTIVCAAGEGNADLARRFGFAIETMQRRPLHMVVARGDLPVLNGHCTDGSVTRVTITTTATTTRTYIWQIGGQIAEDGINMAPAALISHARKELHAVLPGVDFSRVEWTTY